MKTIQWEDGERPNVSHTAVTNTERSLCKKLKEAVMEA